MFLRDEFDIHYQLFYSDVLTNNTPTTPTEATGNIDTLAETNVFAWIIFLPIFSRVEYAQQKMFITYIPLFVIDNEGQDFFFRSSD